MEQKPLKNFGMITESEFMNKTLEHATEKAVNDGFVVRVVENNGHVAMVTMEYRRDRINFRVKNNVVIGAYGG